MSELKKCRTRNNSCSIQTTVGTVQWRCCPVSPGLRRGCRRAGLSPPQRRWGWPQCLPQRQPVFLRQRRESAPHPSSVTARIAPMHPGGLLSELSLYPRLRGGQL